MSNNYRELLGITKKKDKEIVKIIEKCLEDGNEKAAVIRDISESEDLNTLEKVYLAYKLGYVYANLGGS